MKRILLTLFAVTFSAVAPWPARAGQQAQQGQQGQQGPQGKQPAFTLVSRITTSAPDGSQTVEEVVRSVSADGNVRAVWKKPDGSVTSEYVYEKGRGGFFVKHEQRKLLKGWAPPMEASDLPPPTAENLRAGRNFLRTEQVLGLTAYVFRREISAAAVAAGAPAGAPQDEIYYAPELGKTPLKEVRYRDGKVSRVSEPLSVTFGEPDAASMKVPDYEVVTMPISGGILNGKAVSKPNPVRPAGAGDVTGTVTVQILADEEGKVIEAKAVSGPEQLRQAAVDAAFKARLSPTRLSGEPVKVQGVLVYNFVR